MATWEVLRTGGSKVKLLVGIRQVKLLPNYTTQEHLSIFQKKRSFSTQDRLNLICTNLHRSFAYRKLIADWIEGAVLHEKSVFNRVDGRWLYVGGEVITTPGKS